MKKDRLIKVLKWISDQDWVSAKDLRRECDFRQNNINDAISKGLLRAEGRHGIVGYKISEFGKAYLRINC